MKKIFTIIATVTLLGYSANAQNVGIGVANPTVKLDVAGAIRSTGTMYCGTDFELNGGVGIGNVILNDKPILMRSGADATHKIVYKSSINGIEITGNNAVQIRTQNGDVVTVLNDKVGIGSGATNPGYRLTVDGNGYFNAGLRIDGIISNDPCPGGCQFSTYQFNNAGYSSQTGLRNLGLWVSDDIRANRYHTASDERIKSVIGISNSAQDLEVLMGIQITDYTYVDRTLGTEPVKKVIAQQVERVYPEAVGLDKSVVPDVYKLTTISNGYIPVSTDLNTGDKVRLIFPDGSRVMANVTLVNEEGFFVDQQQEGEVFVYGRETDDFRIVDYDAISMLNVSATQEQQRLIESLMERVAELEDENAVLKGSFEARLKALEAASGMAQYEE